MPDEGNRFERRKIRERPPRGNRVDIQCGLGINSFIEFCIGPIPHEFGKGKTENGVGFFECLFRNGELCSKSLPHPNSLRALAREYECRGLKVEFHETLNTNG